MDTLKSVPDTQPLVTSTVKLTYTSDQSCVFDHMQIVAFSNFKCKYVHIELF